MGRVKKGQVRAAAVTVRVQLHRHSTQRLRRIRGHGLDRSIYAAATCGTTTTTTTNGEEEEKKGNKNSILALLLGQ
jgi:hypothetical protein